MLVLCATKPLPGDKTWNANSGWHCTSWCVNWARRRGFRWRSFFDWEIVAVYLWAVVHDRPASWACDPANWPEGLWNGQLPSQPTMSRRLQTTEVQQLLADMERRLAALSHGGWVMLVDSKPVTVGPYSKDPDAAWGRARRGWAKGYKLHAIYDRGSFPVAWDLVPLNESEPEVAARLVLSIRRGGGYLLGDKAYDSNPLHDAALAAGCQLVAERKRPKSGLGHRRHSPGRLRSIQLLAQEFGQQLYAFRDQIERNFGWLTNHAAGLAPLPNWLRRIWRVRTWVQAKLIIHALYVYLTSTRSPLAIA
jgi:DDE family transposase